MAPENPHDVVRVATAPTPAQAHIMQQALEAEGISAKVVGDYLDAGIGDIPGVNAEIWVHRDDQVRAEEIIRRGEEGSDEDEE